MTPNRFVPGAAYAVSRGEPKDANLAVCRDLDSAVDRVAGLLGVGDGPEDADEREYLRRAVRESTLWEEDDAGPLRYAATLDGVRVEILRLPELNHGIPPEAAHAP